MSDKIVTTLEVDQTQAVKGLRDYTVVVKTTREEIGHLERAYKNLEKSADGAIKSVETLNRTVDSGKNGAKDTDPAYLKLRIRAADEANVAKEIEDINEKSNAKILYKKQRLTENVGKTVENRTIAEREHHKAAQKLLDEKLAYAKNIQKQLSANLESSLVADANAQLTSVKKVQAEIAQKTLEAKKQLQLQLKNIDSSITATTKPDEIAKRYKIAYEGAQQTILDARNSGREKINEIEKTLAAQQQEIKNQGFLKRLQEGNLKDALAYEQQLQAQKQKNHRTLIDQINQEHKQKQLFLKNLAQEAAAQEALELKRSIQRKQDAAFLQKLEYGNRVDAIAGEKQRQQEEAKRIKNALDQVEAERKQYEKFVQFRKQQQDFLNRLETGNRTDALLGERQRQAAVEKASKILAAQLEQERKQKQLFLKDQEAQRKRQAELDAQDLQNRLKDLNRFASAQQEVMNRNINTSAAQREGGRRAAIQEQADHEYAIRQNLANRIAALNSQVSSGALTSAAAQQRISEAFRQTTQEINQSRSALESHVTMHESLASKVFKMIGLYRAFNFAIESTLNFLKSIPAAGIEMQSTISALHASFSVDPRNLQTNTKLGENLTVKAMEMLRNEADRTGISLVTLETNYRSFLASAHLAGESTDTVNSIFKNLNTTITALHMTSDRAQLTFLALAQMFNKGKIQSEELVKQLGNLLPGAFAAFAKANGLKTQELIKQMKAGAVQAHETVAKFAEFYAKNYADAFTKAASGLNAELGRMDTAWTNLSRGLFGLVGGAIAATVSGVTELLNILTPTEVTVLRINSAFDWMGSKLERVIEFQKEYNLLLLAWNKSSSVYDINQAIFKGQQGTIDPSNRFNGIKLSSAPLNVQQRLVEEELTKQALFINKFEEELKTKQASGSYAESYMKKNADLLSKAKSDMEMLVALNNHLVDLDKNLDKKNALSGFDETHNAAIEKLDEQLFRNVKAYEMEIGVLEGLLKKQGGKFAPEFTKDGHVNEVGLTESKYLLGMEHANQTLLASVEKRNKEENKVLETIEKQVEKYKELGEKIKATLAEEEARKTKAAKEMGTGKKEDLEQETLKLYQTNKEIESTIEKLKALEGQTLKTASAYKDVVTGSASVATTGLNLSAPAVLEPNLKKLVQGNLNSIANPKNQKFVELISSMAAARGIDRELALAMVAQESKFNANATSPANAHGLMQMIPATARRYGVTNAFDPVDNIKGGLAYLADLLKMFKGNVSLALAGYNAGEGAVKKYNNQIPPYKETQNYEKIITATISSLKTQLPAPKDTSVVVKEPPLLIRRPDLQTPEEIKAENAEKTKSTEQLYDQLKALQKKAELSREIIDELLKEKKLRFEIDKIFSKEKEETVFDAQKTLDVEGFVAGTATIKQKMQEMENEYKNLADEGNFLDKTIPQLKAKLKELGASDSAAFKQQSETLKFDVERLKAIEEKLPKIVQQYGGLKEVLKDSAKEMEKLGREQQKILNAPIKDLNRQILKASLSNKSGYLSDVIQQYNDNNIFDPVLINIKLKEVGKLWEELQQTINEKNLYEGFVSNFQSGFSEVIQNGKDFGTALTDIFDSSISTILNNSLKDLVDGFTDAFSNIAGASEGAWEKVGASLFKIGISALGSWLKSTPKENKPSASADVQLPATGLASFKSSDLFSRSTSTTIASTVSANYNAQLEKVISLAYSNSSSIVGFIGNVGTKLSSMSTVASTTFTAIGNFLKPVTSLISSGYNYLVDIGTKATTYFGSLFANGATKTLETAGASATSKLPYIGAAISVLKAGYDIYKTATDDQAALGTQIANSMYAVSDALTVLATTNIWNPAGWVGLAAAAATSVVGSISDIIDGDAKRGIYSLAGSVIGSFTLGIYGALIGGMFGRLFTPQRTPNSWINGFNSLGANYSPAEMNKYSAQAPGYKDIGDNVYQRGTNKGLFLGTNTRLGSVELSYHEIPRKTNMEELDNSFKALLIYYKLVNDQFAESLSVMDDANNETGQTLIKFLSNLGDGAEKNRIVFKQELDNFNSADSAEFYYEKIGERLIATGTKAGKIWGTVYKNLSAAWVNISDQSSVFTFDSALVANNIATNFSTLGLQVIDDLTSKLSVVKAGGKREDIQKQLEGNFGTYFKITSFLSDPKFGIQASFNTETISGMIKAWNTFSQDIEGLGDGFISFASLVRKSNPGLSKEAFLPTVQAIQTGIADKFISKGYTGEQALSLTNSSVLGASSLSSMGVGNDRLLAGGIAFAEAAAKKANQTLLEANASIDAAIEKGKKEGILNEKMSRETQLAILVNTKALDAKTISEANFSIQQAQANKTYLEGYDLVSGVIAGLRSSFDGFGLTVETLPQVIDNITNAFGDLKTAAQTAENTITTLFGEKAVAQQKLETGTSLQKSILNELPENIRNQLGLSGGMTSKQVQETLAAQAIKNNVSIQDLIVGATGNVYSGANSIVNRFAAATRMVDAGNGLTPGQAFQTGNFDITESSTDLENKAKENRKSFLEKQASVYKEISSLTAGEFERTFVDIDSYINDLAESVKELNEGSLTGLETLKNLKYQEAFKPLKDELDSIGKSDAQKAFDKVNKDINDIYNTINSRTDATPILESLNKIKASRIAEIAKPIVELVDGLVKSASRLNSSDFETSLFSILDKAETDFKTLAENPTTTWNQAKSAMDSTIALAANAYEKAAKDLEKLYSQIAKSIRVASESVQDALFDIRYKTVETILNSQVGNLLNSSDPNVRSSAGQIYSSGKAGLVSAQNAQDFKIFTRAFNEFNNSVAGETFSESIDRQISGITKVQSLVQTRYNREMQNIQEILSASNAIGEKLKSLRLDSNLSILSPKEQFAEALQQYQSDSSLAKAGNKEALTRLPSAIDVLLNLGKTFLTSGSEYRDLFDYVMSDAGQFNLTPENVQEKIRIASEEANTYLSNIETKLGELEELRKKSQAEETQKLQNSLKDLGTQFSRSIQKLLDGVVPGNQIDVGLYASNGLISSKNDVMIGKSAKGNRTNTDDSSLLLEEVRKLREAIEKQNKLEDERTGDVILSNYDALDKSTSKLSKDLVSAIEDIGWKNKIAVTLD